MSKKLSRMQNVFDGGFFGFLLGLMVLFIIFLPITWNIEKKAKKAAIDNFKLEAVSTGHAYWDVSQKTGEVTFMWMAGCRFCAPRD